MCFSVIDLSKYNGVGPAKLKLLHKIGLYTSIDLLFFIPSVILRYSLLSAKDILSLATEYMEDDWVTKKNSHNRILEITNVNLSLNIRNIKKHFIANRNNYTKKRKYYSVIAELDNEQNDIIQVELIYFHINSLRTITSDKGTIRGECNIVFTKNDINHICNVKISFVHPDFFDTKHMHLWSENMNKYCLTKGLHHSDIIKLLRQADIPKLPEWIPNTIIQKYNFLPFDQCIYSLHFKELTSEERDNCLARLACDELLYHQLMKEKNKKNNTFEVNTNIRNEFLKICGFDLTYQQKNCLQSIDTDLSSNFCMFRLLHGDVGSGKTIISFLSIINVIIDKNSQITNNQVAFIAPTEVLALQHYNLFKKIAHKVNALSNLNIDCITGSLKEKNKKDIKNRLESGAISVIFGTHALFQDSVKFNNLKYVVIDEQHKFGVKQRSSIIEKGTEVNILIMSATPIPRTLEHVFSGYLDVSKIEGKIPGRIDVATYIISSKKIEELSLKLITLLEKGERGYWVCPAIDLNEDMGSVQARYDYFVNFIENYNKHNLFNLDQNCISILHSGMTADEKNFAINEFREGRVRLLISTTVIEIGIDVPSASFIAIENAERFGLAQLHQLRGRVGRGYLSSYCFLIYEKYSKNIWNRLNVLKYSNDGFVISEKDLLYRGGGEFYGIDQSGSFSIFSFVDYEKHANLIQDVQNCIELIQNSQHLSVFLQFMTSIKMSQ